MSGFTGSFLGIQVYVSDFLPKERKQVRFPKSKRKRIRKKWAKDPKNYAMVETAALLFDGHRAHTSPKGFALLQRSRP
jgi:hypothetical protein